MLNPGNATALRRPAVSSRCPTSGGITASVRSSASRRQLREREEYCLSASARSRFGTFLNSSQFSKPARIDDQRDDAFAQHAGDAQNTFLQPTRKRGLNDLKNQLRDFSITRASQSFGA